MPKEEGFPTAHSAAPSPTSAVERLLAIMARLRDPVTGCQWDSVQTFQTIAPYTIEEAYEVADACVRGDLADLKDELGDLLLQVVFHARMAEEAGAFAFADIATAIADKMERRHPHLFPRPAHPEEPLSKDQVVSRRTHGDHRLWEQIKAEERGARGHESALDGVAIALPALLRAEKLQKRAARTGFDWPDPSGARAKIDEELAEVAAATTDGERAEEIGDLLFAAVNWARKLGIDPEAALRMANAKFERRFRAMERMAGGTFAALSLSEQEDLWSSAKAGERVTPSDQSVATDDGGLTIAALRTAGFRGWLPFSQLRAARDLPSAGGIYIVVYGGPTPIEYPGRSIGGWFKGRDPSVTQGALAANWVPDAEIVYIGKADQLRRRLIQFADFGDGKPIGHWGGRLIWQLPDPARLQVAWRETPGIDPRDAERDLIERFRVAYGRPPFANDPQRLGR